MLVGALLALLLLGSPLLGRAALVNAAAAELARTGFRPAGPESPAAAALARGDTYLALAARLAPDDPQLLALRGQIALQRGDLDRATAYLEQTLARDPTHTAAGWWLGALHAHLGRDAAAVATWRTAGLARLVAAEAERYAREGDRAQAARWAVYAAAIEPTYMARYLALADDLARAGRYRSALDAHLLAVRLLPDVPAGYLAAAHLLAGPLSDPSAARALATQCRAHLPDPLQCPDL